MSQKPVQILHLIKSLGRGGAEMLLPETVKLHDKNAFQFHCIYFLPWKNQMVDALEAAEVKVTCLNIRRNLPMLASASRIADYCRQHNISIIHCHLPWAGFVGRLVAKLYGIKVIYTEHNKQERYNRITATLNKLTFNWQKSAIAVSADVKESIVKNIRPGIPVDVVLNGVNTHSFIRNQRAGLAVRNRLGIAGTNFVIGTLAVFRFQKRLDVWLDVLKAIHTLHPEVRGIIVGDGPLKEELIAKRTALGLDEIVYMPGLQTNTVDWFSAMDTFMMSSIFEGLPIALLEAMSCSCPVVLTNAGGIKEVVRHEQDGLLCDVEAPMQLAELASSIIANGQRREAFSAASRNRVVQNFSLQTMVEQLEGIYSNLH